MRLLTLLRAATGDAVTSFEYLPRIAVEMGVTDGWWKYGCAAVVGIDTYGESAPAPVLFKHFGFTTENVVATVRKVLSLKK